MGYSFCTITKLPFRRYALSVARSEARKFHFAFCSYQKNMKNVKKNRKFVSQCVGGNYLPDRQRHVSGRYFLELKSNRAARHEQRTVHFQVD